MPPTPSSRRLTLATQPDNDEQIVVPSIRQIITAPVATQHSRISLLYGVAAAFAAFAPVPFGPLAAFTIAILAAERKK